MSQYAPSFDPKEYELRGYTNPYLTPEQSNQVSLVESRVSENLDFVAQMLGWSGPNYWSSLATTVDQKRQLLSGTYGVYKNFIIPAVHEIRNWDDTLVISGVPFLEPGKQSYIERVILGEDIYSIQDVKIEGSNYVIYLGPLPQSFYDQVAANIQIKIEAPTYRPAPFYRPSVGVSGDGSFFCSADGTNLTLYPSWDTGKRFPYLFPILFAGSVYYFNQPVHLQSSSSGADDILPVYDPNRELWYLRIPSQLSSTQAGIEGSLVWSYSDSSTQTNASLTVKIQSWVDPSDWGSLNVLNNFRGVWNNKGGSLPFNFVFDALSIHGYNEQTSLYLDPIERTLSFNNLVGLVYSQTASQNLLPLGGRKSGDLWWNPENGALSSWTLNDSGCGFWVEVDYRTSPVSPSGYYIFADVTAFSAGSGTLSKGTIAVIQDTLGLSASDNVIGVQGALPSSGSLILYKADSSQYWTPTSFSYSSVSDFTADSLLLPYKVPVIIRDSTGLNPNNGVFQVSNLSVTVTGDYETILMKLYRNNNWELQKDLGIPYVADSSLFSSTGYLPGEMWWDFSNPDPNTRAAAVYYDSTWVSVNSNPLSSAPAPALDMSTLLFYADGVLLVDGVPYSTDDFTLMYTSDPASGQYSFTYTPRNFKGKVKTPVIQLSDSLTTAYRVNITEQIFGGIQYKMSPNVYDAETTLRVWKGQDLQDAETVAHLTEDNYVNPLIADLNNGPGPESWERYFIRMPLDYERNGSEWQKVSLVCQDFGYWGSTMYPEKMRCPPEDKLPAIYEELFLYDQPIPDYTYVYCEPYLYSNLGYIDTGEATDLRNAGIFPSGDDQFDDFTEASLVSYEPLHNRQADVVSAPGEGYGDWVGEYVNVNPCEPLTGFLVNDLVNGGVSPVPPPVWDASIYKFAPTCESDPESYTVDSNHYKVCYSYFVADASVAEDPFFDITQEASWRYPVTQPKTLYVTPR